MWSGIELELDVNDFRGGVVITMIERFLETWVHYNEILINEAHGFQFLSGGKSNACVNF